MAEVVFESDDGTEYVTDVPSGVHPCLPFKFAHMTYDVCDPANAVQAISDILLHDSAILQEDLSDEEYLHVGNVYLENYSLGVVRLRVALRDALYYVATVGGWYGALAENIEYVDEGGAED